MKEIDRSIYWDIKRTLTHNSLINVIVGNRGGGKSYGAKKLAIDNFIKKREKFGYIRRYKDDLTQPMKQFFKDIEWEYPDYEFKTDNKYFYIRLRSECDEKWTEDDIAGYGFVLSTANNKKSISYPDITLLIYDEFLLDKGTTHYIKNEPIALLNLYETVARPGTQHPRVILFMLANALSISNPYFLYWDLKMPTKQDKNNKWIWKHPTRPIIVEDVRNEKFIDTKKNTEFGSLVSGTSYADYSIENKFLLDDPAFIEKRTPKSRYYFTFVYKDYELGVWMDIREGLLYVSKSIDPKCPIVYAITMKDHRPNTIFFRNKHKSGCFKVFLEHYKLGNIRFEDQNIKNLTYEIIKMTIA